MIIKFNQSINQSIIHSFDSFQTSRLYIWLVEDCLCVTADIEHTQAGMGTNAESEILLAADTASAELRALLTESGVINKAWVEPIRRHFPIVNPGSVQTNVSRPPYPTTDWRPKDIDEIISREALDMIERFRAAGERDAAAQSHKRGSDQPHRARQREVEIGPEHTRKRARGVVWDLRDLNNIQPVRNAPANVNLKFDWIRKMTAELEWPDERLLDDLEYGWPDHSPDMPFTTILSPHHKSLWAVYESSNAEVLAEQAKGWSTFHSHPPFWPLRCIPQGSVPKPRSVKMRRCGDMSWPRTPAEDGTERSCNAHMTVDQTDPVQYPRLNNVSDAIAIM